MTNSSKHTVTSPFDEIADQFDKQIPRHIREYLCIKKVDFMIKNLQKYSRAGGGIKLKGLDCGCGTGWHVKRFQENGFIVNGTDRSMGLIKEARANNNTNQAQFLVSSADKISFKDASYDFIYFINVLHHLDSFQMQKTALAEACRLLKKGGMLFIHEANEEFFLFRFYVHYIFPLTNKAHGGDRNEQSYLSIKRILELTKDVCALRGLEYFTFFPNIVPAFAFPACRKLSEFLEKCTKNKFGAHWVMTLEKKYN